MNDKKSILDVPADFSLVQGGPLFQFYLRFRLVRPPVDLLNRRIGAFVLIAWIPLLLLTLLAGQALRGVKVPFLLDLDAHARFLISVPLLLWAEQIVHAQIRSTVLQFLDRGLIATEDRQRFDSIIASNLRLRNSALLEIILLGLAFIAGHWLWREQVAMHVDTWYAISVEGAMQLTSAGYWFAFVSLPIGRFLALRWYFRILLWYRFLWLVSRVDLKLDPLHPDYAGGLGFLGNAVYAFSPIMIAHSILLAGVIANLIWHEGAKLPDFKLEIAAIVCILILIALLPLMFFYFQMERAKRYWRGQFDLFAIRYTREFRQKWLEAIEPPQEVMLGSADIQSLADLGNSYQVVREMRLLPFNRIHVLSLAVLICLPILPLTLTIIPLEEMLDRLIKILM